MDFFKKAEDAVQGGEGQDLVKEAQGFVGGGDGQQQSTPTDQASSGGDTTTGTTTGSTGGSEKTDYKKLYGDAQTLYGGIEDKASGKSDVSNDQLAGAADDVLKAAESSGLDKNNQYGQYFDKAEGYLEKYKQGDTGTGTTATKDATTDAPKAT